jgi:hypothetical protein
VAYGTAQQAEGRDRRAWAAALQGAVAELREDEFAAKFVADYIAVTGVGADLTSILQPFFALCRKLGEWLMLETTMASQSQGGCAVKFRGEWQF